MPKPRVVFAPDASQHLSAGIDKIADLLALTLGPVGGYIVNERMEKRGPEILDDSAVIVRRILSLAAPDEDMGAMLMRNLVWRMGEETGDGGAMAAVMARAMYKDALRLITAGASPVFIEQGVNAGAKAAIAAVREQARPVTHENQLAEVARLIIRDDQALAAVLGEMSYLLGPDAHVVIDNYITPYLERRYLAGTHYPAQISSLYFYSDPTQRRAVLTDAAVAISDSGIEEVEQAVNLIKAALALGRESLFIVAPRIGEQALAVLIANHQSKDVKLNIAGAMLKDSGVTRQFALSDLGLLSGGRLLGTQHERTAKNIQQSDLGFAKRVEIGPNGLLIVAASYSNPVVRNEVARLRAALQTLPLSAEDRPLLLKRLSALSGGVGELKIGALGKHERQLRRQQAERALKVLSLTQRGGVVPGGGAALYHSSTALKGLKFEGDAAFGVHVLERALAAPLRQILKNSHVEDSPLIMAEIAAAGSPAAYDVLQKQVVDAHQAGLIDPVDVLTAAISKAASGAMKALSTDVIVYHRNPQMEGTTP